MISFRTRGNFIDFVLIEDTTLQAEHVLMSLHNTSKAIDWSYDENPLTITFTINEKQYSNIPISSIDFDGTTLTTQAGFETNIEAMFPNLAGGGEGGSSYLVYTALMEQVGENAPDPEYILENNIGAIVWTRNDVGDYLGTLAGAFPDGKVWAIIQNNIGAGVWMLIGRQNNNAVYISTQDNIGPADDKLFYTSIEIRVYP